MKLSIIIPVFNEEGTIEEIIRRCLKAETLGYEKEIIVVNDGSNDNTQKILKNLKEKFNFILLEHSRNLGKGAAIKSGLKKATGNLILIQDADLEYNPNEYQNLLKEVNQNFPIIYGSRNLGKSKRGYFSYFLGGKLLTAFFNLLFGSNLTDLNTGYKLFRADIIKNLNLQSNGFEFCEEVTAKIFKAGFSIKEVPIDYYPRKFSEGKKVRFWDGLLGLWTIIRYRIK